MSFGVSRRGRRLRVQRRLAERAVREARAPRHAVVSPDGRDLLRFNRAGARAARIEPTATDSRWATGSSSGGYSRAFVERLIVPQAVGGVVGRPGAAVELPGALPGRVLRQPRDARRSATARAGGRSPAARTATSRRSMRPLARPPAALDAGARDRAPRRPRRARRRRGGEPERFDEVVIADALRPGAARCSPTPPSASASCSARSPTSPTRPCCTPTARCCRAAGAPGRAGTTTCSSAPSGRPTVTYHMNRLQSLRADRELCVTLNRTRGDRPGAGDRARSATTHPVFTPAGVAAQRALAGDRRRATAPLLRRLLGLGLPRGRRRQRAARVRALRSAAVSASAHLRGHRSATGGCGPARTTFRSSAVPHVPRPRRAARAARRPSAVVGAPAGARMVPPRATTSAIPRCRWTRPCATSSPSDRVAARRAGPAARRTCATFGHCFNPVSFYYCFDAAGERVEAVVAEVTNTPWGERHAYVLAARAGR